MADGGFYLLSAAGQWQRSSAGEILKARKGGGGR
jgi:hypothetical protein